MSSRILGNKDLVKKARKATPQDKNIYINWEALEELPEQYEAVITAVRFDPKKLDSSFTDVGGGKFMPTTELMYEIAEARGISGGENSIAESVYEEVDINPMLCKGMEDQPTYRKIKVGAKVVKFSTVMEEDGTLRRSSPCTQVFNVWDRCNEAWSKEEKYSEGYTKQGKYAPKYKTKYDRKAHLDSEMKFAMAKAETKAHGKTIRELAGLTTGYTAQELRSGELLFAKIRKSSQALKLEQAAHLSSISGGTVKQDHNLLFGTEPEKNVTTDIEHEEETPAITRIINLIKSTIELNHPAVDEKLSVDMTKCLEWLEKTPDAESGQYWNMATDMEARIMEVLNA